VKLEIYVKFWKESEKMVRSNRKDPNQEEEEEGSI
jgi:hypothetical protein